MRFHDMIVLACMRSTLRGARDRAFSGGKRLAGDVWWAHPKEHLWRVWDEEGCTYVVAQGEAIPVMGAFGEPLRRTARKDACPGNIDRDSAPSDGTMSNVHTTYPRMGRGSSHS